MQVEDATGRFGQISITYEDDLTNTIRWSLLNTGMTSGLFDIFVYDGEPETGTLLTYTDTPLIRGFGSISGTISGVEQPKTGYYVITIRSEQTMKITDSKSIYTGR